MSNQQFTKKYFGKVAEFCPTKHAALRMAQRCFGSASNGQRPEKRGRVTEQERPFVPAKIGSVAGELEPAFPVAE